MIAYMQGGPAHGGMKPVNKKVKMLSFTLESGERAWYSKSNKKVVLTVDKVQTSANVYRFERIMPGPKKSDEVQVASV